MLWTPNVEKLSHPDALKEIIPFYQDNKVPTILLHSDIDKLVPFANATFLMTHLDADKTQLIELTGFAHPIQMNAPEVLVEYVLGIEKEGSLKNQ